MRDAETWRLSSQRSEYCLPLKRWAGLWCSRTWPLRFAKGRKFSNSAQPLKRRCELAWWPCIPRPAYISRCIRREVAVGGRQMLVVRGFGQPHAEDATSAAVVAT